MNIFDKLAQNLSTLINFNIESMKPLQRLSNFDFNLSFDYEDISYFFLKNILRLQQFEISSIELVSVSASGEIGNAGSGGVADFYGASAVDGPSLSMDGRFITFASEASNLTANDSGSYRDIFVYDQVTGQIERVIDNSTGNEAFGSSRNPEISADGMFVTFSSRAFNLVDGLPNSSDTEYIYVYDRSAGVSEAITPSRVNAYEPDISGDGRFVTFWSRSDKLVPNDNNGSNDIFVYDRQTQTYERISLTSDDMEANDDSWDPQISMDGRYVVFHSDASNLVANDLNGQRDIFVYDRETGTIEMVSVSSAGVQGDNNSWAPHISSDGRVITFASDADNLVAGPSSGHQNIYVHDRNSGITELISIGLDGTLSNGPSGGPHITADGRYVSFYSAASVFVENDTNNDYDIFVYDRVLETFERVSVSADGAGSNGRSRFSQISPDGQFVAFPSLADNLVANDTNGVSDIFVVERQMPDTSLDDIIIGTPEEDILDGMAGNDTIYGRASDDILIGGTGNDVLYGEEGDDTLFGGEGADILDGGSGFDTASYAFATSGVMLDLLLGGTGGEASGDVFTQINSVIGSDFNDVITGSYRSERFYGGEGNDVINAGGGVDQIYGGTGNDVQRGQDGNDALYGSAGADQLNGGAGRDQANYIYATSAVEVNLVTGGTLGDAAGDTYFGIETVFGTNFDDIIIGNSSNNFLIGMGGNDTLDGGGGNDVLLGTTGADILIGGTGIDTASYINSAVGQTLDLTAGGTAGHAAGDTFSSIEWVFGSRQDDNITGDNASNRLEGRDGNDILDGAGGNDRLLGGDGNDTIMGGDGVDAIFGQDGDDLLFGGADNDFFFGDDGADSHDGGDGIDTVSYLPSSSGVTLNLQTGGTGGDAAGDTFTSIERIFGSGHDDNLTGSDGNDTIIGNGGDDFLTGGLGNDSLNGGAGIDSFAYNTAQDGADVIQGFTTNEVIDILFADTAFDSFSEIMAVAVDAGANTLVNFGDGNTLTIVGQNIADLSANNFTFTSSTMAQPLDNADLFAADVIDIFDMDALL